MRDAWLGLFYFLCDLLSKHELSLVHQFMFQCKSLLFLISIPSVFLVVLLSPQVYIFFEHLDMPVEYAIKDGVDYPKRYLFFRAFPDHQFILRLSAIER